MGCGRALIFGYLPPVSQCNVFSAAQCSVGGTLPSVIDVVASTSALWIDIMDLLDYIDVPANAVKIDGPKSAGRHVSATHRASLSIPDSLPQSPGSLATPTKSTLGGFLPNALLNSTLASSMPSTSNTSPRSGPGEYKLLSTRDPLSLPITTVNFRRFVAKTGPIFWMQDCVEEILLWRKGWKVTTMWMSIYAFLCE